MSAVQDLATEIAAELGEGWTLATDDEGWEHGAHIVNPDGVYLFVRFPDQTYARANEKGKVQVSGSTYKMPGFQNGDGPHGLGSEAPRIQVTRARGSATIAKEIRRRLLADVERDFARARENIARRIVREDARAAVTKELADALHASSHNVTSGYVAWDGQGYGSIEVGHDGTNAKVTLSSLPIEAVRDVVDALSKHVRQEA